MEAANAALKVEPADKPGSVQARIRAPTAIHLGHRSPGTSSGLPGRHAGRVSDPEIPFPIWPCSVWGLPCRPRCRRRGALLPHRFTLA